MCGCCATFALPKTGLRRSAGPGEKCGSKGPTASPRPTLAPAPSSSCRRLLNFWGAALDGKPESYMAGVCYEVAMGDVELDQGPMKIIMSYLHKEDHEN